MGSPSAPDPRARLPTSPLPPAYAVRSERERLQEAMIRAVAAHGYEQTTIAAVTAAARVSREDFDRLFSGKEDDP